MQKIFNTMHGYYGNRWANMWKLGQLTADGMDTGVINAMNTWADALGGYVDYPEAIKIALANLPDDPPTLPKFKEMLRQAHIPAAGPALTYQPSKEEIERNKQKVAKILAELRQKMEMPK